MDENQRKEAKKKLKELRKELEDKIKEIIPDALKSQARPGTVDERIEDAIVLDEQSGRKAVESVLFASSKPLSLHELKRIIKPLSTTMIVKIIDELKEQYEREDRSFRINEIAGGYEISTLPQYGIWIARLEKEKKMKQASLPALETLAILAYKQPVTRVEIEEIRGVDVSGVISTLLEKNFITIVGRKEVPGRPLLYGTTDLFLEHFGLPSLHNLPDMVEIKALVDDTIKREELLRKEHIVKAAQENAPSEDQTSTINLKEEATNLADKYEEIAAQVEGVKVKSLRQISEIIDPSIDDKPQNDDESKNEEQPNP
ncbi:MAG: SMC-Scp complex subunit ScpB [Candidatus Omnitrophica bacterium]|nr:SMC-Scp complex subunit ScpB [Candidatus Omnitrophota bacterium]